jgi:hypothetical protein
MKKVVCSAVLLAMTVLSCKKESPVDKAPVTTTPINNVEVTMDVEVEKDDNFQLYYAEDGTLNFKGDVLTAPVKGQKASQKITFILPDDAKPNNFRIDVGDNINQGKMKINSFMFRFHDKKFKISGQAFFQYFSLNGNLIVDAEKATMTPAPKDGSSYDPMFYPAVALTDTLTKIVKK